VQKIPERLELVPAIPRNPTGKILKNELRETYKG
jgi:acyl-CoA synthetase (AMP-forming)/AMP-acid ligase II